MMMKVLGMNVKTQIRIFNTNCVKNPNDETYESYLNEDNDAGQALI